MEKVEVVAELKDLITGKFKDINDQVGRLENQLGRINQNNSGGKGIMGQVLGANLLTMAISRAGGAAVQFGKDSFDAFGRSEQFLVSLTTMFKGNAAEAKALDNQLKNFAIESPFELTEIRDATKMMIAYGSASGNVVDEMRMLGDISSGVGSSISEVAYLYGTLRTQGRAFSRDIYQFTGRGIPIIKELAKQFKVTDGEVMKLVEDGKVGFKEVEKAMQGLTGEGGQFHNMMLEQSKTLLGQTSNLSDAWNQLESAIGSSQQGILKDTIAWATDMVRAIKSVQETKNFRDEATSNVPDEFKINKQGFWSKFLGFDSHAGGTGDMAADTRYFAFNDKERRLFNTSDDRDMFLEYNKEGKNFSAGGTVGTEGRFNMFSNSMFQKLQKASGSSNQKQELAVLLRELTNERAGVLSGLQDKTMSSVLAKNELAVIDQVWKEIQGLNGLAKSKSDKAKADGEKKPKDLDALAKANRQSVTNVHIENLVKELTNNVGTPQEALAMNTNQIAKALIAAVNDIEIAGQ